MTVATESQSHEGAAVGRRPACNAGRLAWPDRPDARATGNPDLVRASGRVRPRASRRGAVDRCPLTVGVLGSVIREWRFPQCLCVSVSLWPTFLHDLVT